MTSDGVLIKGIGIFPIVTVAGPSRFIGNTIYRTEFGDLAGYENHSGLTTLDDSSHAVGTVIKGDGNNGIDKTEGCIVNNVFGLYSHGPLLSKNTVFADELLQRALERKYPGTNLSSLDDKAEKSAFKHAIKRPR